MQPPRFSADPFRLETAKAASLLGNPGQVDQLHTSVGRLSGAQVVPLKTWSNPHVSLLHFFPKTHKRPPLAAIAWTCRSPSSQADHAGVLQYGLYGVNFLGIAPVGLPHAVRPALVGGYFNLPVFLSTQRSRSPVRRAYAPIIMAFETGIVHIGTRLRRHRSPASQGMLRASRTLRKFL